MRKTYDNRIAKVVWAIYYLMVAILVFIILQLFSFFIVLYRFAFDRSIHSLCATDNRERGR